MTALPGVSNTLRRLSHTPFAMSPFTVGDYLAERIAQIDIRHHFIVPGDYNLILLDKLGGHPSLTEIGCTNELNCSLAAEGYARGHGVSVCIVTYSVGAFSAFNGIGSAYAENLPVILISGSPNTNDVSQHILHHTLGIYDTTYQLEMAKKITCCAVRIRQTAHAPELIDRAIRAALTQRKPVYIEVPTNLAGETCPRPGPISSVISAVPSDRHSLDVAVTKAAEYIGSKQKCVVLVGPKVRRAMAQDALRQFVEAIGSAVVLQPAAKGTFPEDHAQFCGIFWGQVSTLAADTIVNWADLIICIGAVFTDYSTVGWTALPSVPQLFVDLESVTVASKIYCSRVQMSYTIEVEIHDGSYNCVQNWDYARLVQAFSTENGNGHALGLEARTAEELSNSLERAIVHTNGPTLIDCSLHRDDCSRELITWGHFVAAANARMPKKE
ncbi:unnamed protein product [Fusarium graminearum]|nr:unnamed protein product [Fusarium graminearum]